MARKSNRDLHRVRDMVAEALRESRSAAYNDGFLDGAHTAYSAGYDAGYSDASHGRPHRNHRASHSKSA